MRRELTARFVRNVKPGHPDAGPDDPPERVIYWDTKQGGLGLKVHPTGTASFVAVYRHGGRPRWYSLGSTKRIGLADARQATAKIMARAAVGEDPQAEKLESREGETLSVVARRYVDNFASRNNKSWRQADTLLRKYVLPTLGSRRVKDVTRGDVRRIFDRITIDEGHPVLANQVLAAVSPVLSWAVEREYIEANVARGIKRNRTRNGDRSLSDKELAAVWPAFDDLGLLRATVLRLIVLTAQRPGEVTAMRWQDVDLGARTWTLPGEPAEGWPGTKNGRTHSLGLPDPAVALLEELGPAESGQVFPGRGGQRMAIPSAQTVWRACEIPRFRAHDLRATAATGMDRLGIPKDHISRILNHVEGGITASYIRHDAEEHKRRALEAWAAHVTELVTGKSAPERVVRLERKGTAA